MISNRVCTIIDKLLKMYYFFKNQRPFIQKCQICSFCQIYMSNMQIFPNMHVKYANAAKYTCQICKRLNKWKNLHKWHAYLEKFAYLTCIFDKICTDDTLHKMALSFEKIIIIKYGRMHACVHVVNNQVW